MGGYAAPLPGDDELRRQYPMIAAPEPLRQGLDLPPVMLDPKSAQESAPMQSAPQVATPTAQSAAPIAPRGTLQGDKDERSRLLQTGSGVSQISDKIQGTSLGQNHPLLGKILGGAAQGIATLGDVGLSAVAPSLAINLPGTAYHHQMLLNSATKQESQDEKNAEQEAQTQNLNLQPQLKQAQMSLNQDKQDEKTQNDQDKLKASLASHGFAQDEENPGNLRPLKYEEMSEPQQAAFDLKGSQEELAKANADLKTAQKNNIPSQIALAQQRINGATQARSLALQRLGLQGERLAFQEDKQYNPEPTANQRKTGDLAGSAVEQVHTMRNILAQHPEFAGPGAGATQAFQRWLSSNGEDAGRFLAAKTYLADHSAAVFGGRGAYITQHLEHLTDPNFSPSTLNGVLDQAESTAGRFVKGGEVHDKGGNLKPLQSTPAASTAPTGKAVSLKDAMALPINKGKSEADVRKDIESHGHTVGP